MKQNDICVTWKWTWSYEHKNSTEIFVPFLCLKNTFVSKTRDAKNWCTNTDLKICQYLRLHMKIICSRFYMETPFTLICAREICEKFVYKPSETIEYVKNYPNF